MPFFPLFFVAIILGAGATGHLPSAKQPGAPTAQVQVLPTVAQK